MNTSNKMSAGGNLVGAMLQPEEMRPATGWRQSRWLAFVEFAIVGLIFIGDHYHLVPISKTPFLLVLGWISLRVRGLKWKDVGFARNRSWGMMLALGFGGGLILEVIQLFVTQPLVARITGKQPDLSDFRMLQGNVKYALLGVALSWTLAAFGEELVWRGYLMNRAADLGRGSRFAWIFSLLLVSAVFGSSHSDQGLTGQIIDGIAGFFLGLMYLRSGRNLAVPIVAHGACDTLDMVLLFFGRYPGT
jgi:membrane protease YdiL (CAAX protease family)